MNKSNSTQSGGIGFVGLLQVVFITLKLCGVIHWSWLWVLSPIWLSAALGLAAFAIFVTIAAVVLLVSVFYKHNRPTVSRGARQSR